MKLYYNPLSGYSIKALLAFAEKDIGFEKNIVNLMDPEAAKKYREFYPIGKVPLLVLDDGHKIPESSIIAEYLDQKHDLGLFPKDPDLCRQARFQDRVCDLYIHNQIGQIFFDGLKPKEKQNPEACENAKKLLDFKYQKLDAHLKDNDFLVGNQYSIADLSLFAALFHAPATYPFEQHKNLPYFCQRIMERPATQKIMIEIEPAKKAFLESMKSLA